MNILILGSGGREHALAWAVLQNPKCDKLIVAPGNAGIAQIADCAALDILDAVGTYAYDGLKGYNWTIDDGPASPVSIGFESISISVVPAPATVAMLLLGGACGRRRR